LYCCDHPLNIGGGTSQMATTLYNAVFRNGFEIIDHRPHSRYINRYPLGIEATLGYTQPDVVFRNDTVTPLTIVTSYTNTSITVELLGNTMGRTTSWWVDGSATYSGGGSVRVYRTIQEADGTIRDQSWSWTYQSG
jgi:vancomycin resistance protein YoaR